MKKELLVKRKPKYKGIILFSCFLVLFGISTYKAIINGTLKEDFLMFGVCIVMLIVFLFGIKHQFDENRKIKKEGKFLINIKKEGIAYINDVSGKDEFVKWNDMLDVLYRPRAKGVSEVFGLVIKMNDRVAGDILELEDLNSHKKNEALMVRISIGGADHTVEEITEAILANMKKQKQYAKK